MASDTLSILGRLVAPLAVEDFLEQFFDRQSCHLQASNRTWSDLLNWDALSAILSASPTPHPTLRLPSTNRPKHPQNAAEFLGLLKAGTTVILEDLDRYHPPIGKFLNGFSRETTENARINMYLTPPQAQGFQKHYDTQDNFILQAEGTKRWRIWPSTIENPLFYLKEHGGSAPPGSPYLECVLAPGDVLYIPRGHWHEALTERDSSVHLTLAMFRRTGIDFCRWVVDELRETAAARAAFPMRVAKSGETVDQLGSSDLSEIVRLLTDLLHESDIGRRYLKFATASQRFRPEFSLPSQLGFGIELVTSALFNVVPMLTFVETDDECTRVIMKDAVLTFPRRAESLVRDLLNSSSVNPLELAERHPEIAKVNVAKLLETFLAHGLLARVPS